MSFPKSSRYRVTVVGPTRTRINSDQANSKSGQGKIVRKTPLSFENAYTPKACSSCDNLNDLGSAKVYSCVKCSSVHL